MNGSQLAEIGSRIYGQYGWQVRLADSLGVHRNTVNRWKKSADPVPVTVELAVKALASADELERAR